MSRVTHDAFRYRVVPMMGMVDSLVSMDGRRYREQVSHGRIERCTRIRACLRSVLNSAIVEMLERSCKQGRSWSDEDGHGVLVR
jgi:hypothetical protein